MKPKSTFCSLVMLVLALNSFSQSSLKNENVLEFEIIRTSLDFNSDSTIEPAKYLIKVSLSPKEQKKLKSYSKSKWIALLKSEKTDWNANLILYHIYNRDAILFNDFIRSRTEWVKSYKDKDLSYWQSHLK